MNGTVTVGVLLQILLVVALGGEERPGRFDLGGDVAVAGTLQTSGEVELAGLRGAMLRRTGEEDRRAVLGAVIVAWRMPWVGSWFSQNAVSKSE